MHHIILTKEDFEIVAESIDSEHVQVMTGYKIPFTANSRDCVAVVANNHGAPFEMAHAIACVDHSFQTDLDGVLATIDTVGELMRSMKSRSLPDHVTVFYFPSVSVEG